MLLNHRDTIVPSLRRLRVEVMAAVLLAAACALALLHPAAAAPSHVVTPHSGGCGDACTDFYVHTTTAANTRYSWTDLDNETTNNHPNAFVFVTPTWNPGGVYASAFDAANVGVWYNIATNKWSIFNEDNSPMPVGAAFNVQVALGPCACQADFVSTATAATISGASFDIIDPATNDQPNAVLLITPTWNGVYDNHPLGVYYHYETGHWAIFHEDGAPMTPGAAYNINTTALFAPYVHTATSANSQYAYTALDDDFTNGNPNAIVFVTQRWTELSYIQTPYGPVCCLPPTARNNSAVSVFYQPILQRWCIYNDTEAKVPETAQFDVIP